MTWKRSQAAYGGTPEPVPENLLYVSAPVGVCALSLIRTLSCNLIEAEPMAKATSKPKLRIGNFGI